MTEKKQRSSKLRRRLVNFLQARRQARRTRLLFESLEDRRLLTGDLTPPVVASSLPSLTSGMVTEGVTRFDITFNEPLAFTLGTQVNPAYSAKQIKNAYPATAPSGIYWIDPDGAGAIAPFQVYADMTTEGGGWMLAVNSVTGSEAASNDITQNTGAVALTSGHTRNLDSYFSGTGTAEVRHVVDALNASQGVFHGSYLADAYQQPFSQANFTFHAGHSNTNLLSGSFDAPFQSSPLGGSWFYAGLDTTVPASPSNGTTGPQRIGGAQVNSYRIWIRETSTPPPAAAPLYSPNSPNFYELRRQGSDGILGNEDDSLIPLTAGFSGTTSTLSFSALSEGLYRLTVKDTLTDVASNALDGDANGTAGDDWVRDFVVNKADLVDANSTVNPSTSVGTAALDQAHAVAIQADGKIVTAGISNVDSNFDFAIARYNVDGTLDATFDGETGVNGNGFIRTHFGNASGHDQALGVAIQGDGKIVAVGYAFNGTNNDLAIARYNSNGSLDTSFDGDGKATYSFGFSGTEIAAAVAIDSQGRILVGGEGTPGGGTGRDFLVARILPSGALDTTFGTAAGKTTVNFGVGLDDFASSMFLQPDGKIVLAGTVQNVGNNNFAIARFDANGVPDTTFDGDGRTTVDFTGNNDAAFSVVVQPDGKVLVAGAASSGTNDDFGLVRLNIDGSLDSSFGTSGKLMRNFGLGNDHVRALALQPNGYIFAGGFAFSGALIGGSNDFAVERYLPTGTLDTSFDADGRLTRSMSAGSDSALAMTLTPQGKIVLAGSSTNSGLDFALLQITPTASQYSLTSPTGFSFDIDRSTTGTGQLLQGTSNAFDGLSRLQVAGVEYSPAQGQIGLSDDGGRTLVTPNVTMSGLTVSREITVPNTGSQDFARTIEVLTNSTGSPITVPVRIVGNLGSDGATTVFATSDGDTIVEATDTWFGTDDADGRGTPAVIHLLHGPNGLAPTSVNVTGDNVDWTYNLTVAAGATQRLGSFTVLGTTRAQAITAVNAIFTNNGFTNQSSAFLTTPELSSLANFQFNLAPTALAVTGATVAENQPIGSIAGTFATTDPNAGNTHTYTLVSGTGDNDNGSFSIDGATLKTSTSFDFEAKSSYAVRIRSTDQDGLFIEQTFVISVTDANDAPTSLALSANSINENRPGGTSVGSFISSDPDTGSTFTYSLVTGSGDTDNASFAIVGNELRTAASFDFETQPSYSIRVRTTDQGNLSFEQTFTITVNDLEEIPPTVVSTTPSFETSGVLAAGTTLLQITFSEPIIGGNIASNFELRNQGPDGILGNADDVLVAMTPVYSGITTTLMFQGLLEGVYRLSAKEHLADAAGNLLDGENNNFAGGNWQKDIVIALPNGAAGLVDLPPLKDIRPGTSRSLPRYLTNLNGTLYFSARTDANGYELWKSDGTPSGTVLVKDISAGVTSSNPANLVNLDGILYFSATHPSSGRELWRSDGTAAGTVMIKDIREGSYIGSSPRSLTNVNGTLYFLANDGVHGEELWKSDGTNAETVLVKDIRPGVSGYGPSYLTNVNGTLFFSANDTTNGEELWKSDGTETGTVMVKDIRAGSNGSVLRGLTSIDGTLVFSATDDIYGGELWRSDGTAEGTVVINISQGANNSAPRYFTSVNGKIYFAATSINNFQSDRELWQTDGTIAGTKLVKDIRSGGNSSPKYLTNVGGSLYFRANNGPSGYELWKSDGTAEGTTLVRDIYSGANGSNPRFLTNVNGSLFFRADDGISGDELWTSDGTLQGTALSRDFAAGSVGSDSLFPIPLTVANGQLFVVASSPTYGAELYKLESTSNSLVIDQRSPGGFKFDSTPKLLGAGQLVQGTDSAFDGLNRLQVGGANYLPLSTQSTTTDDGGRTTVTANVTMSGLSVSREITVPSTGTQDFARTLDVFTNPTGTSITVPVRIVGNLGSDLDTTVFATSDGDTIVEATDTWIGTDDADGSGTPAIIHLLRNAAGIQPTNIEVIGDNVVWDYSLTVPAGQTVRLAHFTVLANARADAATAANVLLGNPNALGGQAAAFLTAPELGTFANFYFNLAPTAIAITNSSIAENQTSGTTVGSFTSTDPNPGNTHTYSLVSGTGDTDNSSFTIDGSGNLKTAAAFNFEDQASYSIRVRSTDQGGLFVEQTFTISVIDVNEAPTLTLDASSSTVAENTSTATFTNLATITSFDDALGTNVISLSGTDTASFEIVGNQLRLKAGVTLDYETQSSYTVTVNIDDSTVGATPDASVVYTLNLTDVNEAPSAVTLTPSSASLAENASTASATTLATITVTDDALGSETLTLSGADATYFEIDGNQLRLKAGVSLDYETKAVYSVTVQVDDTTVGATPDQSTLFTLTLIDIDEIPPTVVSTTPSFETSGVLAAGTTSLQITFSEPIVGGNVASNFELRSQGADGILGNADDDFVDLTATYSGTTTTLHFGALSEGVFRLTVADTLTDASFNALDGDNNGVAGGALRNDFVSVPTSELFPSSVPYQPGSYPLSVVSADFNSDGILDLVTANSGTNDITLSLGDGLGSFVIVGNYASGGSGPFSVTVGDFNADGKDDLAVANPGSHNVGVLIGNGSGGFASAVTVSSGGTGPRSVTVGDFNADGKDDLAVANQGSSNVGVLIGNGSGGFASAVTVASGGSGPISVTVGDFNADGKDDLAVANSNSHSVGVLIGNGSGGFASAVTVASGGSFPRYVTVGDFNADGKDDLAVANLGSHNVGVLIGNGSGGFASAVAVASGGSSPISVTVGDFNADGKDDLVVANYGSHSVRVLIGNGSGDFASAVTVASGGSGPNSVTVGDFNADGKDDLAVANYDSHHVGVLIGNGNGGFASAVSVASGGSGPYSVTVGDFNADGKDDLAVANEGSHNVGVLIGNGSGGFASAVAIASGGINPYSVTVGDFNADGKDDLAVANYSSNNVGVLIGNGNGGFASAVTVASGGSLPFSVTVGDFNADGKDDLAVANRNSNNVSVLIGNGNGGFASAVSFASGGSTPRSVTVGDFNADGKDDLAVANQDSHNVGVLIGNGSGGFASAVTVASGGSIPTSVTVGDFNADGKDDLAVANYSSNNVGVLIGNGNGGFASAVTVASGGSSLYSLMVGDFNADGKDDLAVANYSSNNVGVLIGNGSGGFASAVTVASRGFNPYSVTVGDFNADGKDDLAVGNLGSHNVGVLISDNGKQGVFNFESVSGIQWTIQRRGFGAAQLVQGTHNAFDGLNRLQIDNVDYATLASQVTSIQDNGRTVMTPGVTLSGLSVSREVTVPDTGTQDFARTVDVFTNPTGTSITVPVRIVGNLGSDLDTTVFTTSDGDTIVEATDTWIGTDDADGSGTPAIIHLLRNAAGIQPTNIQVIGDNVVWDYSLTVPAGQTVRLAHFTVLATARTDAATAANVLLGNASVLGGQAAAFLTPTELSSFANFKFNQAPTALALSNASIPENSTGNTTVGTFTTTDPDAADTHTYSLVSGAGDTDNGAFILDGNSLNATSAFDFETKNSYSIRVRTTDNLGAWFEQTFTIQVTDVNEAPTAVVLTPSSLSLAENTSTTSAIVVATIAITDDALGTNALTLTGTDAASFEIAGNQLRIKSGVTLNYEAKSSYSVTVNVDDNTVGTTPDATASFTLNLMDVNEPPTAVSLTPSNATLPENTNTASAINLATINITDDAIGSFTMTLSGADAASFEIFANQLRLNAGVSLDYETKSTYSVRVNVDDVTVGTTPDAFIDFTLSLTDVNEAPTMVIFAPNPATLPENASTVSATVVATLTIGDDFIGTNTLSLSGADADSFQIVGPHLRLKSGIVLDFETKPSYTVTVNVDDVTVGNTPDASTVFILNLIDVDEVPPTIASVSPALTSGVLPAGQTSLSISYSESMQGGSTASNFELRRQGADGLLGTADDALITLSPTYAGNTTTISFAGLADGVYRLTAKSTLTDVAGNALDGDANGIAGGDWVRDFVVNRNLELISNAVVAGSPVAQTADGASDVGSLLRSSFSDDGRYVVFASAASNLVSGDNNSAMDIFLKDRYTGVTTRVSTSSSGVEGNNGSFSPVISGNGRYVAFFSNATNLIGTSDTNGVQDVFRKDLLTGTLSRVSIATGVNGAQGNGDSYFPAISPDGRYVAFQSYSTNFASGDTNGDVDVFLRDTLTNTTSIISSVNAGNSRGPAISDDGRYVGFISTAGLVAGDNNSDWDVYLRDRNDNSLRRVSTNASGTVGNGSSLNFTLSGNGQYLVFHSNASNLVAGDTNNVNDVFLKNLVTNALTRVSVTAAGGQLNVESVQPSITADGRYVLFQTTASLVPSDTNGLLDVYVKDTQTGAVGWASGIPQGSANNGNSTNATFSRDGRYILFQTLSNNLVGNDNNSSSDVLLVENPLFPTGTLSTYTLTTPNNFTIDLDRNGVGLGQIVQGSNNAFDGLNRLQVNGFDFVQAVGHLGTTDDGGRTLVSLPSTISGLTVSREITVPSTGSQDFARTIEVLTNSTGSPITVPVRIVGNLGSDGATTVFATSDGDTIVEPTDTWFGTDDADGTGTPAVIHLIHGPYGLTPSSVNVTGDNVEWSYNVTVAAGATQRLAGFTVLGTTRAQAIAAASALFSINGFTNEAATFLTAPELASLANFQFNVPPTALSLAGAAVAENQPIGTTVGSFATTDPNVGNTHTYTLVSGAGSTDNGSFTIDGTVLKTNASFDFETKNSYAIRVRTTDQDGLSFDQTFTVTVTDANDAPTALTISATSVNENRPSGTTVGSFTSTDPDVGNTFTYALVTGTGDTDNASFTIVGNELRAAASFDFETKSSYSIRVRTTDQGNLSFEQTFTITVNDFEEIPPTIVSTTPNFETSGVLAAGTTSLQITFSEPVVGGNVASNFELRSQGADGILGNADDLFVTLTPSFSGTVTTLGFSALVEGIYQLVIRDTLTDGPGNQLDGDYNGSAGGDVRTDFVITDAGVPSVIPALASNTSTYNATVGDFNNDSWLDVAYAGFGPAILYYNNQAGGFSGPVTVPNGADHDIAAADFNKDGWIDLVGNSASNGLRVTLNDGTGGFRTPTTISSSSSWYSLVTGDFNEDTNPDIAIAGHPGQVRVFFGNGLGVFPTFLTLATPAPLSSSAIHHLATGDVNKDGHADLVTANMHNNATSIFLGTGAGTFSAPATFSTATSGASNSGGSRYVSIGDVNGDSNPDLVVADPWFGDGVISVLLGDGSGLNFGPRASYSTGNSPGADRPYGVTIVDFDGDLIVDLLVSNREGGNLTFMKGTGTGAFPTTQVLATAASGHEVIVGDFNRDGRPDAVVSSHGGSNGVQVLTNTSSPPRTQFSTLNGTVFDIDTHSFGTGQLIQGGTNNAFDGLNRLHVNGTDYIPPANPTSTTVDGGRTVVTPNVTLSGLTVSREITVPNTGTQDFARTVDVFANPTSSSITVPVRIVGNLGSDLDTTVFATSDGDAIVEATDTWIGTDDADGSGTPAIVHLLRNAAGIQPTNIQVIGDNVVWDYSLTVPAGQTVRLAHFTVLATARTDAATAANVLLGTSSALGGQATAFLTPTELSSFANFKFNQAPTALALSNTSIPENSAVNTTVGVFTTTDPDVGDTHTYSLVPGTGDIDNGAFTIAGNSLKAGSVFNFEAKSSYAIRVRTTDAAGAHFEQTFTIEVNDINEAPTANAGGIYQSHEGGLVQLDASLSSDPDLGDSIVNYAWDLDNNGTFETITGSAVASVSHGRPEGTHTIRLRVTDSQGLTSTAQTILVVDGNREPTAIALSQSSIAENQPSSQIIGLLTATDPDPLDTHSFSLVSGTGAEDNAAFLIVGNELRSNAIFNFEAKSSYSVRVRATDQQGLSLEQPFVISVSNIVETYTLTVTISGNGSGTVTSNPAGLSFTGNTGVGTFDEGTLVQLTATPAPGSVLSGWSGAATGSSSTVVLNMDVPQSVSADFQLVDVTRPVSAVQPLPLNATSLSIPITVSGSDPSGPTGSPVSGVKEYDVYVAEDSGPFIKFATVPVSNPNTVFTASSNRTYFFRSIARDNASPANEELSTGADAFIRVGDFGIPVTQVTSANANSAGLFTVTATGTKPSGVPLTQFDIYVAVDGAAPTLVGTFNAGTAVAGVFTASGTYQGLADGVAHSYRFYSRGRDLNGNLEAAPASGDVTVNATFAAPAGLQGTGIDVQLGATQRSYIRYVDVLFSSAAGVTDLTNPNRVKVEKFAREATDVSPGTGTNIAATITQVASGNRLRLDFGSEGLGGARNTIAGDGFYRVRIDTNGDGDFSDAGEAFEFHRLLGDANGDKVVDALDTTVVDSFFGQLGANLEGDLNGDGVVNTTDKALTQRTYRGRKIADLLKPMLDD